MTLTSERLQALVEADDPVDVVWEALWDIWCPAGGTPAEHYGHDREWESVELERTLVDIYWESNFSRRYHRCDTIVAE